MNHFKSTNGLTLLETLIAMGILATLMAFTAQNLAQALRARTKVQTQIDDLGQVRDVLRILEKDLNLAFNYIDFELQFRTGVRQASSGQQTTPPRPPGSGIPGTPPPAETPPPAANPRQAQEDQLRRQNRMSPRTHFVGTEDALYFFTLNRQGFFAEEMAPDFSRVSYQLKSCSGPAYPEGQCLIRTSDFRIFQNLETGFENEVILLDQVEEFSLKYLPQNEREWVNQWDSRSGQGGRLNQFPRAVEITLKRTRSGQTQSEVTMQLVARVSSPNNRPNQANTGAQR